MCHEECMLCGGFQDFYYSCRKINSNYKHLACRVLHMMCDACYILECAVEQRIKCTEKL
jgi:hypothetical protein